LVDDYGQPWLLEVNHAPSFGISSEIDKKVKENLIKDTCKLLNINPKSKRRKMNINAKELQERVHNNKSPKEYIHIYNTYGEREMLKQIRHETKNLGNYEKIP
jgi:tubulin polyglutamylase TTLL6/13